MATDQDQEKAEDGAGAQIAHAIAEHFRSIDSAPKGFAANRPPSVANGFFVTFTALSLLTLSALVICSNYWGLFPHKDIVFYTVSEGIVRLPIRLFFILFFLTYSIYAHTNWQRRVRLMQSFISKFLLYCLIIDLSTLLLKQQFDYSTPIFLQQLISGLCAMAIFPHTVMRQAQLPPLNFTRIRARPPFFDYLLLALVTTLAVSAAIWVEYRYQPEITSLRAIALLGGVGPGIFLVQQVFALSFAAIGNLRNASTRRKSFTPPIAVLIPAHNEAHSITDTIQAVDDAAETYDGDICLYVVDNCSRDNTTEVSKAAISQCEHIKGEVLYCGQPGKAIALNYGLDQIAEEFVVRIDADTVIGAGCLATAMRHFSDPKVGSVGGLPLPIEKKGIIRHVRLVEVLLRHGFFQVALGGFGGILGVPGMFAVYRHSVVKEIGGTTEGMNGEDTDIVLRMNAAGYRVVSDPKAVYYSETPISFSHLREQRLRWFRSIYHISAHNQLVLFDPRLITGTVVLPFMLLSAARRAMLSPLLIYCALTYLLFDDSYTHLMIQAALALMMGMPLMMAVIVCILLRRFDAIPHIPAYLCFRMLRSYFTLASVLTLVYPPLFKRDTSGEKAKAAKDPESEEEKQPA